MVGPLGHWTTLRAYQLATLKANGLRPDHRVLDLGCGPLQGGVAMIEYLEPSRYFGVDLDAVKLAEGYRQVADLGLTHKNPRLIHSATFGVEHLDGLRFDFIWASQMLYYFDAERLRPLLGFVADKLHPEGKLLGDILGKCDRHLRSRTHLAWCRSVKAHSVKRFQALAQPLGLEVRPLGRIDAFGYPKGLSLCSNVLLEITRAHTPQTASPGTTTLEQVPASSLARPVTGGLLPGGLGTATTT
jgi:SAM-dependent methyltransferase